MTARTFCLVPGCRRSTAKPYDEWICGKHWTLVPRDLRKRRNRAKRKILRDARWRRIEWRLWERCKAAAINANFMDVIR